MASTFTALLGLEKPGNGEQDGSWGDTVNANMDAIDTAIGERVELTAANQTITGNVTIAGNEQVNGTFKVVGNPVTAETSSAGFPVGAVLHNPGVNATVNRGVDLTFRASTAGAALGTLATIRAASTGAANNSGSLSIYGYSAGVGNLGVQVKQDGTALLPVKVEVGDVNFFANLPSATTPRLTFDTNDYYQYDRTTNVHGVYAGGVLKLGVNSSGPYRTDDAVSGDQLPRKSQMDTAIAAVSALTAQATETARGTVELATSAEVDTGSDTTRVITPATLHSVFSHSHAATGYQEMPGGLIIQWGTIICGTDSTAAGVFATTFPNAILSATATVVYPSALGGNNVISTHIVSLSTSGITVGLSDSNATGNRDVKYIAIGY